MVDEREHPELEALMESLSLLLTVDGQGKAAKESALRLALVALLNQRDEYKAALKDHLALCPNCGHPTKRVVRRFPENDEWRDTLNECPVCLVTHPERARFYTPEQAAAVSMLIRKKERDEARRIATKHRDSYRGIAVLITHDANRTLRETVLPWESSSVSEGENNT